MADATWIRAYGNKSILTPGTMQAGYLQSTGNAYVAGTLSGGYIQGNAMRSIQYAPPGGWCSGGSIGYYGGSTMTCSNSVWSYASSGARFGGMWSIDDWGTCRATNPLTGGCSYPAGYTARYSMIAPGGTGSVHGYWCHG